MTREAGAIEARIREATTVAMKSGDKRLTGALRLLTAALTKERIDAGRSPSEADELAVLKRERKRRLEAAGLYDKGGRPELAEQERYEEGVIAGYLPEELSGEDLARIVDEAITETGATAPGEMGGVMKAVMGRVAGRADGRLVSAMVKERLGG